MAVTGRLHRSDAGQHGSVWAARSVLPREDARYSIDKTSAPASAEASEARRQRSASDTLAG